MIRVAFFGLPLAAWLLFTDGFEPELAVLSPSPAPGRRRLRRLLGDRVVDARDLDERALDLEIERRLVEVQPDLVVSWYWTRRLPERWLARARLGAIGAHPSLLPRHRGPNPFFAAIDSGDAVTGVTVHRLVERYDEGDILLQETLPVENRNAWQLARALDRPSLRLLRRAVRDIADGCALAPTPQDEAFATWAPEPAGDRLRVDWRWPTERVLRRIRALSPVPGLAIEIRGVELFITVAEEARSFPIALAPGEAAATEAGVVVRTGDAALLLVRATVEDPTREDAMEIGAEGIGQRVFGGRG